ncbi:MAG: PilZ domain-containing protein [Shimia sp.]|nr:PilZ domain-containing protein [Shimia sp.]
MDLIGNRRHQDNRKSGKRHEKQLACEIQLENHSLGAKTVDIGVQGACIEASLNVHRAVFQSEIRITLPGPISRKAKIVWSSGTRMGLNFAIPLRTSQLEALLKK